MNWTKDKPTKEGFYWVSCLSAFGGRHDPMFVDIYHTPYSDNKLWVGFLHSEVSESLDWPCFEDSIWMGPMTVPSVSDEYIDLEDQVSQLKEQIKFLENKIENMEYDK